MEKSIVVDSHLPINFVNIFGIVSSHVTGECFARGVGKQSGDTNRQIINMKIRKNPYARAKQSSYTVANRIL